MKLCDTYSYIIYIIYLILLDIIYFQQLYLGKNVQIKQKSDETLTIHYTTTH